jgi:hypothetical protein
MLYHVLDLFFKKDRHYDAELSSCRVGWSEKYENKKLNL